MHRRTVISDLFSKAFDGTWEYTNTGYWWCDDGERYIKRIYVNDLRKYELYNRQDLIKAFVLSELS